MNHDTPGEVIDAIINSLLVFKQKQKNIKKLEFTGTMYAMKFEIELEKDGQ